MGRCRELSQENVNSSVKGALIPLLCGRAEFESSGRGAARCSELITRML